MFVNPPDLYIMKKIYRRKREIALFLLITMCAQVFYIPAHAQLSPTLPADTKITEIVDLFTGDVNYSIPIVNIPAASGSYPINLSYASGNYHNTESGWVGMGWTLSMPSVTREVKGVPDEFEGDEILAMHSIAPNITVGAGAGVDKEVLGRNTNERSDNVVGTFNIYQNNVHGLGYAIDNNVGYHNVAGLRETRSLNNPSVDRNEIYNSLPFLGLQTSVSHPALQCPTIPVALNNTTTTFSHKTGNAWAGSFAHGFLTGYYTIQQVEQDGKFINYPAFGAFHSNVKMRTGVIADVLNSVPADVTRSGDLVFSRLNTDEFVISGTGKNRVLRQTHENTYQLPQAIQQSTSIAHGIGNDNAASLHTGSNKSMLTATTYAGCWKDSLSIAQSLMGEVSAVSMDISNKYGVQHNNSWSSTIHPFRLALAGKGKNVRVLDELFESKSKISETSRINKGKSEAIQMLTNADILNRDGKEVMPELNISYRDVTGNDRKFDRKTLPPHHLAAITSVQADGTRYTYGLPSYVLAHEEVVFSGVREGNTKLVNVGDNGDNIPVYKHPGVFDYLSYVKTPKYAASHLITSIVGTDYIDLKNDGLSSDDQGYWVKFSYKKVTTDNDVYKHRHPFSKAILEEGNATRRDDDKGIYTYTEKELWYVDQIETNTHTVKFITEERQDAFGAKSRLQDKAELGKAQHALKEIRVYSKDHSHKEPIKIVKFEYDYSLFKGAENSVAGTGKLTLKKVWFEDATTTRGRLTPYIFTYTTDVGFSGLVTDRWGILSAQSNDPFSSVFVDQQVSQKSERDKAVAVGNLSSITTPTGRTLTIQYESDDYAYVQHLPAAQMTPLVGESNLLTDQDLKVRFRLNAPLLGTASVEEQRKMLDSYLNSHNEIYFKVRVNLLSSSEPKYDWIDGTAVIDESKPSGLEKDKSGNYAFGYVHVLPVVGYHPFAVHAWKHIRETIPTVLGVPGSLVPTLDEGAQKKQIERVVAASARVRNIYEDFFKYCNTKGFGREVDHAHSFVRLSSPTKTKLGGEARVKQVTMTDGWNKDAEGVTGYWLDYTQEENGVIISSGVAENEPASGTEENVLLSKFPQLQNVYPQATIGYSHINVYTLASASLAGKQLQNVSLFPKGEGVTYGTKGLATYKYYTAREFPIIVSSTGRDNKSYVIENQSGATISQLVSSQGYCVVKNDMHGKFKGISYFRQQASGEIDEAPIAREEQSYFCEPYLYDGQRVFILTNRVASDKDGLLEMDHDTASVTLGVTEENFVDLREVSDDSWQLGNEVNDDDMSMSLRSTPALPIHVKGLTENAIYVSKRLKTSVFNRLIEQSGIKSGIVEHANEKHTSIQYLKFDAVTGMPMVSSKSNGTNNYIFEKIFSAYHHYKGMGPASVSLGRKFLISDVKQISSGLYSLSVLDDKLLCVGDEMILKTSTSSGDTQLVAKALYLGKLNGIHQVASDAALPSGSYSVLIVRSGNRNQLNLTSGKISAADESVGKEVHSSTSRSFIVPKY